jgi:tight adherence protein B
MLIVSVLAFFVVIFLLAAITVAAGWMGFLKSKAEESDAAQRDQETGEEGAAAAADDDSPLFRSDRLSTINFMDSLLTRLDFIETMKTGIAQADLNWSVGRMTALMLLCGAVALAALSRFLPFVAALAGAVAVAYVPYAYILQRRNQRFQKFRENFPDVLDSLARALRAGYPLSAGMEMIATETAPPVSLEMRRTSAEANLGMGWPRALENLGQRIPLLEVNLFIAAVQLHSRTGGKLSEVMGGLAENMREAVSLQGEVRSLAAHGKLTGIILTILPIGIAIMMTIVSPGYMTVLFNHPWGKYLITGAITCLVLAHVVIRKIVDIKI